jgi:hypothetical protein
MHQFMWEQNVAVGKVVVPIETPSPLRQRYDDLVVELDQLEENSPTSDHVQRKRDIKELEAEVDRMEATLASMEKPLTYDTNAAASFNMKNDSSKISMLSRSVVLSVLGRLICSVGKKSDALRQTLLEHETEWANHFEATGEYSQDSFVGLTDINDQMQMHRVRVVPQNGSSFDQVMSCVVACGDPRSLSPTLFEPQMFVPYCNISIFFVEHASSERNITNPLHLHACNT